MELGNNDLVIQLHKSKVVMFGLPFTAEYVQIYWVALLLILVRPEHTSPLVKSLHTFRKNSIVANQV